MRVGRGPALQSWRKKYLAFSFSLGKQSSHQNFEKPSRNLFSRFQASSGTSELLAIDREKKANQRPFDRVSVGFHRSSASLVGRTHRILFHARILQRILMIAFFAR
jgi:hypothetical protein